MNSHHRLGISAQKSHYSLHRAYFIQRHSALITHYVLFSRQRAAFPIHFSDIPYASSTRIIKISIVLNFAPKPPHGTALVTEGQKGTRSSPKADGMRCKPDDPVTRAAPRIPAHSARTASDPPQLVKCSAPRGARFRHTAPPFPAP